MFDMPDIGAALVPGGIGAGADHARVRGPRDLSVVSRIDTRREAQWLRHGGILPYVLNELGAA